MHQVPTAKGTVIRGIARRPPLPGQFRGIFFLPWPLRTQITSSSSDGTVKTTMGLCCAPDRSLPFPPVRCPNTGPAG
ncbi:hypothetical protein FA13DRAFT_1725960 [Coprinellus micaceus]|uniref:Uncharacterized protein n=1 Tax=Coprinellus micaceus TaxID=71717 RepID=A0A4Y7TWJ3_COPMI|nr:hypothetical protein FA13DRAFT_1725960 [Coprinellus micaceus]